MKTKWIILTVILLFCGIAVAFAATRTIKGNGKATKKTFSIEEYNQISVAGAMSFEYSQSTGAPYLEITLDENLFEYLDVRVEGKTLKISPKTDKSQKYQSPFNLKATTFKIVSNSKELKKLDIAGSGNFTVKSSLKGNNLELNTAGSGSMLFAQNLTLNKLKLNLAGSGNINITQLKAPEASCNIAGSGSISLAGTADEAAYNLSGSGKIEAYDFVAQTVSCNIAGSGSAEVHAEKKLNANIIGSGNVYYKGTPEVKKSTMGSGKVKTGY